MRVKVGKQSRKAIQFYRINFNFREPYKIILDGNFIKVSLDKKVELRTKLEKVLGGKILLGKHFLLFSRILCILFYLS